MLRFGEWCEAHENEEWLKIAREGGAGDGFREGFSRIKHIYDNPITHIVENEAALSKKDALVEGFSVHNYMELINYILGCGSHTMSCNPGQEGVLYGKLDHIHEMSCLSTAQKIAFPLYTLGYGNYEDYEKNPIRTSIKEHHGVLFTAIDIYAATTFLRTHMSDEINNAYAQEGYPKGDDAFRQQRTLENTSAGKATASMIQALLTAVGHEPVHTNNALAQAEKNPISVQQLYDFFANTLKSSIPWERLDIYDDIEPYEVQHLEKCIAEFTYACHKLGAQVELGPHTQSAREKAGDTTQHEQGGGPNTP